MYNCERFWKEEIRSEEDGSRCSFFFSVVFGGNKGMVL